MGQTPSGQSDIPEPATITVPWCPVCHRLRFGPACPECGEKLVLQEFVHRRAYDELREAVER